MFGEVIDALEELEKQEAALRVANLLHDAVRDRAGAYQWASHIEFQELLDEHKMHLKASLMSERLVELARADLVAAIRRMFTFVDTADEIEARMTGDSLNCPACGGSGHVEDAEDFLRRNYVPQAEEEHRERMAGAYNNAVRQIRGLEDELQCANAMLEEKTQRLNEALAGCAVYIQQNAALRELAGRMLALLARHHRVTQLGLDIHMCPECDRALPLNHKAGCEWEKAVNDARKLGLGG